MRAGTGQRRLPDLWKAETGAEQLMGSHGALHHVRHNPAGGLLLIGLVLAVKLDTRLSRSDSLRGDRPFPAGQSLAIKRRMKRFARTIGRKER
jgi:hypothetical protein